MYILGLVVEIMLAQSKYCIISQWIKCLVELRACPMGDGGLSEQHGWIWALNVRPRSHVTHPVAWTGRGHFSEVNVAWARKGSRRVHKRGVLTLRKVWDTLRQACLLCVWRGAGEMLGRFCINDIHFLMSIRHTNRFHRLGMNHLAV